MSRTLQHRTRGRQAPADLALTAESGHFGERARRALADANCQAVSIANEVVRFW